MFQQRRQAALGNINLGSLSAAPSEQDINFLQEQAARYRGRFVEVTWNVAKTGTTFQLTAKFVPHQQQPTWMLYRTGGAGSELIWGHTSSDLTLMHNLVMLECEKQFDDNKISANSINSMINANDAAGSVMSNANQASTNLSATLQPMANKPSSTNTRLSPTQTWLQNVSEQIPKLQERQSGYAPQQSQQLQAQIPPHQTANHELLESQPIQATISSASAMAPETPPSPPPSGGAASGQPSDNLLDGSLSNITVPKLLLYLAQNQVTGRLALQSSSTAAEVFFKDGVIIHAATLDYQGEFGLLDAATWGEGEFNFHHDDHTAQLTLELSTEDMIIACQKMLEFSRYLKQTEVRSGTYFGKARELNRAKFDQTVQGAAACSPAQLWRLYDHVDGNRCLSDLLRLCPMTRPEWIPAIYALLVTGVITVLDKPAQQRPGMFLEAAPVDESTINAYLDKLSDPEDLALRRDAFLYFLQQEYYRHERTGAQFALAIFNFASTNRLDGNVNPFSKSQMRHAAEMIMQKKRKLDCLGHFGEGEYALLLPETDSAGAAVFANRIIHLVKKQFDEESDGQVLMPSFGIASVPQDVRDLSTLLAAAKSAKSRSKMIGAPVCIYGDG